MFVEHPLYFDEQRQTSVFVSRTLLDSLVSMRTSSAGFLTNDYNDVTWPGCKQTHHYGPESSIDDSFEVSDVNDVKFALFTVKTALALFSGLCIRV